MSAAWKSRLQQLVWQRAEHRCEYCQYPADVSLLPFQIDHIIAEKHGVRPQPRISP